MLESTSTPNPAIAVMPEASTAIPVERYVRPSASASSYPAARSWRKRSDSSTLNSVEIAITSAPSVADIGFSGIPVANRISADQPVASAIGISGTSARCGRRNTISSTIPTASSPASSVSSRRPDDESAAFACAASTGSPASLAVTPAGGCSCERHVVDHPLLL